MLFFLGVITFQALLTAGLILGMVSRNNQMVTREELHQESMTVYENYNSWVRKMWKTAIEIRNNPELWETAPLLSDWEINLRLSERLTRNLQHSGIDSFVIRRKGWNDFGIISDAYPRIDDFTDFVMDRDHPYLSLKAVKNRTVLVASLSPEPGTEIFLLKNIDADFYNQLKTRDHTRVFVSTDQAMWPAIGDGEDHSTLLDLVSDYPPYREKYDLSFGRGHYNVSIRNLGRLEENGPVRLLVFMSVEPYFSLLVRIARIVLFVTLATAGLTAVMALFSSGRLTRPVKELAHATRSVREGNLDIMVPEDASGEIRELVEDFNSMVHHLRENRITLGENLKEITFLKEYNETIVHSLRAGILVVDDSLRVEKSNSFFRECFSSNRQKPEGRKLEGIAPAFLDQEIQMAARSTARGESSGWNGVRREGETVWEVKIYPLGSADSRADGRCVVELDDISAKTDLEQKILQAEKLSSLSLLSAGVAHEINNPLSTILSNAQMLLAAENSEPVRESLEWIERETRRIAEIVRDLRNFSHHDEKPQFANNLNECVAEVVRLVRYGVPSDSGVEIRFERHPEPISVVVPREELRQAILNLLQNAVHAVNGNGTVTVKTELGSPDGGSVIVSDTGIGIPDEIRHRIFDPFFTTKTKGLGTGLGLSIVYGTVRKFGGDIDVKSRKDRGSVFTLTLPGGKDSR